MTTGNEGEHFNWGETMLKGGLGTAFVAVAVATLKAAEKFIPFLIAKKMRVDVLAGINELSAVYSEMENAIQEDGAERVLMFAAHNGGKKPTKLTPFFTSVIHAAAKTIEQRQRASGYSEISVDSHYQDMLIEMDRVGYFHFTVGKHPGTMLQDFYEAEGVTDSLLFLLGYWNNKMVYCSFAIFQGEFSPRQITRMKLHGSEIKKLLDETK